MARIETDPNYTTPTFPRATAATDLFKKEDVQKLAEAMSTHDHSNGKGATLVAGSIPAGSITSGMIADGTIVAGDIADGAVTSAKILDGTVATIDIADGAVTNAKLGADTARANLLTNGGFEIWQRGTSGFNANGQTTADRWQLSIGAGWGGGVAQDVSVVDVGSKYSVKFTNTTLGTGTPNIQQKIENFEALRNKTVTASVRVLQSAANAVRLSLSDGIAQTDGSLSATSGSWVTLTVTRLIASNATTLLVVVGGLVTGAQYIDNAMLVVGSVASDYAPLHPADDLARCQRYYSRMDNTNQLAHSAGLAAISTVAYGITTWPTEMAVAPTVTFNNIPGMTCVNYQGANVALTNLSASVVSIRGCMLNATTAGGLVSGNATYFSWTAAASISVEANP